MAQQKKAPSSTEKRGVLRLVSGSQEAIKLRRDATIFGRENGDVVVGDREMSSTHCQIQNIGGVYHIFDMNSTNGTFVNNERIVKAKLTDGDVITMGQSNFKFSLENENQLRHIATVFKNNSKTMSESKTSLVDTLIDNELKSTQDHALILTISYTDGKSEEVELRQKNFYIGRATSFGRFDQDPEISRKHLLIKLNDSGEVFIEDQGSTNGSFLNGKKIKGMHLVRPQDEVKVGSSNIRIRVRQLTS